MKNKIVLITGASAGIGRETALLFAEAGARLAITYNRDRAGGIETEKLCRKAGAAEVVLVEMNVADNDSIQGAVNRLVQHFKSFDILINNAGVAVWKNLADQGFTEIEQQVRVNLEGLIKMTKVCLPYLGDMIINIASGAGLKGYAQITPYCASKWGVRGFSQALAQELSDIHVVVVNPDMTATGMTDNKGRDPKDVADVILKAATREITVDSGGDINVWDIRP